MRLIDAENFSKAMKDYFTDMITHHKYNVDCVDCNADLQHLLDEQPTAYDVDMVAEELESFAKLAEDRWVNGTSKHACQEHKCWVKAIEIVKQGGVSDDVCEWEKDEHSENDNPAEWIICPHKPKRIFSKDIKYCPYCGKKIKVVGDLYVKH